MVKLDSFKLVKKQQWRGLIDQIAATKEEIASATAFIKEIEQGNLDSFDVENADANSLTGSLVTMRNKMKAIAQEEKDRNWVAEGLAKFSEILRSNNDDLHKLSDRIISGLVKYMEANQGGLYLINRTNKSDINIEMVACYAYDRKKHVSKKVGLGEGLLGQAALEKQTIYMTDIPADYVKITSGLGEATPRNIIIVPLKLEEEVYGLVELASFHVIKKHQLQFLEKLSETLASTIAAVKTQEQTQNLLMESQTQAEQLRSQEEEVRQNMEELAATQEEMQRILNEVQRKEKEVSDLINASTDAIVSISRSYKIILFNTAFAHTFKNHKIQKDFDFMSLFSRQHQTRLRERYGEAFGGKGSEVIDHLTKDDGTEVFYRVRCVPVWDESMGIVGSVTIYVTDITEFYKAKNDAETLAKEAQSQTEELKSQEEELKQNMEEMQAIQDEMQRVYNEVQKNEKEITELLNVSKDSIMTLDRDFNIVLFNKIFSETIPLKIEKGFNLLNIFPPEDKASKKSIYDKVFAGERIEIIDHSTITGTDTYHRVMHAPLYDSTGKVNAIAIYAADVTELYKSKQQAEQNEKAVTELINVTGDSILTLSREFKVLQFNKAFADSLKGLNVGKGFEIMSVFPAEERDKRKEQYNRAFAGETFEILDHSKISGQDLYYKVKTAPLFDINGKIDAIAIYASDVTELYKAKEEAERKAKEAQQQTEELRSQEEEIRQNMEEMQAIQEELNRKNTEMEKVKLVERDRAEALIQSQKKNMQNVMTRFKQLEMEYKNRIAELEKKQIQKK